MAFKNCGIIEFGMGSWFSRNGSAVFAGLLSLGLSLSTYSEPVRPELDSARNFWAYQLPKKLPPPQVRDQSWVRGDIDRFVLAKLESQGLHPVKPADPGTLLRRVYYDLTGLPPTPEQIDTFLRDETPGALERVVDRLLASPQFGERWGRHWLDVARFGESVTLRGLIFREAWRYRDYVIEAFNSDLPFDRFIVEQIAGDLLPSTNVEERRRQMIATTFLALGNANLEEQDKVQLRMDVVDEQLDTIGKAFLAQTIGCARCHDHKFDPIPTRDYYAMAGILRNTRTLVDANVSNWIELPLPLDPAQEEAVKAHNTAVVALQNRIKSAAEIAVKLAPTATLTAAAQSQVGTIADVLKATFQKKAVAVAELPGVIVDDTQAKQVGEWQHSQFSGRFIGKGYLHDQDNRKGEKTLTFHPELLKAGQYEVRLAYVPGSNRATAVPVTIFSADGETTVRVNQKEMPPIDGHFVSLGTFRFEQSGQGFVLISNEGTQGHVIADAVQFLPLDQANLPTLAKAENGTAEKKENSTEAKRALEAVKALESELKKLTNSAPPRPKVMSVQEDKLIGDTYVHIRGSVHNRGSDVPRGFLQVATSGTAPTLPTGQSGRRELGEWLASPSNPLTARVMANRIWQWLLGEGLVRTTENFGFAGEKPSHPELLDYLAVRFVEQGWSVKKLIREIMLSSTYQLSTASSAEGLAQDPENRLWWKMNRRRLEAECLRDTILFVSGQLKDERGGSTIKPGTSADYGYVDTETRRSVYLPVFRNALPELFEAFDFADPSLVTGRRNSSTVAPQALFFMNHPFVMKQARLAAERILAKDAADDPSRIDRAYRMTLGRPPADGEKALAIRFFQGVDQKEQERCVEAWTQFVQALFASIDFRYLD
jgi:hypothetical protein